MMDPITLSALTAILKEVGPPLVRAVLASRGVPGEVQAARSEIDRMMERRAIDAALQETLGKPEIVARLKALGVKFDEPQA
jgi:hypothetical protein